MMPKRHLSLCSVLSLALAACSEPGANGSAAPAASSSAAPSAAGPAVEERLSAILAAEQRRAAAEIGPADQQSRDVAVRRAAARALARIGGDAARLGLLRALSDEDEEVLAWGAYGLGFSCKDHEGDTVSALVARALSYDTVPSEGRGAVMPGGDGGAPAGSGAAPAPRLDAWSALARAIGRCGADASEPTLVAWLGGSRERAIHAAYALGDLAAVKLKLREETLVALLNLAAGSAAGPPVPEALYPIGRLENVPPTVMGRIRDVATARLAEAGGARSFAVRALGRAGDAAAVELARVLTTPGVFTPGERAEAALALKRLDIVGQRALEQAVSALVPSADPVALTGLVGEDLGVLLTVLDALRSPGVARKALRELAALPPPPDAPASVLRRVAWIRCGAAKLLAGDDHREPLLAGCDVSAPAGGGDRPTEANASLPGSIGGRAVVAVLGRSEIAGARLAAWRAHAEAGDVRAREAALALLSTHEEIAGAPEILAKALSAGEPGLIATAAEVLAKQPQRASEAPGRRKRGKRKRDAKESAEGAAAASPAVVGALLAALERPDIRDDPELIDTVLDAVGALALKQAEPRLEELCKSSYPTTRAHAEKALGLLRGRKSACDAPAPFELPAEASALLREPVALTFDTDAGSLGLTLDPAFAPVAVTRFVDLARSGYYTGKIVHRVVPGFVSQFGAPFGDGYGGPPGRPALRCETSPLPFEALRVGVALAGRDTGGSQLFVMHARAPHLDGQFALVGTATGPWAALVDGDVIRAVRVGN